jgi:hypothetical protein
MKFSVGDKVVIKTDVEEMQNGLLELVDGLEAVITEIYQNSYEPDVDRFEVELVRPLEFNNEEIVVVPGLYQDNIDLVKKVEESRKRNLAKSKLVNERRVSSFKELEYRLAVIAKSEAVSEKRKLKFAK